jgi:hypothetical protein
MSNENAVMDEKEKKEEFLDFDMLERKLEEELELQTSELEFLEQQKDQVGNPEALGDVLLKTVWEQFTNQIALVAGEDFIKANNGLTLDLSKDAHFQTTENFAQGHIAAHNTQINYQERFDQYQSRFKRDEQGNIVTHKDHRTGEEKISLKKDSRKDIDKGRPRGTKEIHKEHAVCAAEMNRDAGANAHLARQEQIDFANSDANLYDLDARANISKGDSTMTEWLNSEKDGKRPAERFDLDEEALMERDRVAREAYEKLKKEGEKRSMEAGRKSRRAEAFRITGKAVRAVALQLLAELVRKMTGKFVLWMKSAERSLAMLLQSVKEAILSFVADMRKNLILVGDTALTVIATSILGPVVSTIKKAWILMKQGWASLKDAVAYIRDPRNKREPVGIMMAQVGKIITTGLSAAGAILLGEAIEKGLMTVPLFAVEIPLLGSLGSLVGILMGAIVSGLLGALVIYFIDKLIAKQQKAQITGEQINKTNEVLRMQGELIEASHLRVEKEGSRIRQEIKERHEATAVMMRGVIDNITSKVSTGSEQQKNKETFDEMDAILKRITGGAL